MDIASIDWSKWLQQRQAMFLQKYCLDPDQLTADQRREKGISRDYQEREVLELLQNAADAAKAEGIEGSVRLELRKEGLIIANTGAVFTEGGVKSLQTPDLSPKHRKNSKLIGCKGLGFRSVLNWTRHPIILSGSLSLAYSVDAVQALITELYQSNENIRSVLGGGDKGYKSLPTPLLPFPLDLNVNESLKYLEGCQIFSRCEQLKSEGFDTIIGMPFDNDRAYENAQHQLDQLRPEFLLFAEGLSQLEILIIEDDTMPTEHKSWSASSSGDIVSIAEVDHNLNTHVENAWHLYSDSGPIDQTLLKDEDDPDSFHLVVAFLEQGLAEPGNLYSFFPTSIPLPIHVLCHATLELEQNRKHLQEGEVNQFVLRRLAEFLAAKIEEQAKKSQDIFHALKLVSPELLLKDYQSDIAVFQKSFIDALKRKEILPSLSKSLLSAKQVKSLPVSENELDWLPAHVFPSIVIARNNADKQFFELLDIEEMSPEKFVEALRRTDLSLQERAALILGIVQNRLGKAFCYKGLLIDIEGNSLVEADRVFQPGVSLSEGFHLPAWANIKILHPDLWELLKVRRLRESVEMLKDFDVREYGLANLILALIPAANRAIEQGLEEDQIRSDLLQVLYKLYCLFSHADERPLIQKASVYALNQSDEWREISDLYFGKGYSKTGEIIGDLYAATPERLLALPETFLALDIESEDLLGFFEWLGAAQWPRYVQNKEVETEFKEFALDSISYPAIFVESDHYSFDARANLPRNCGFRYVQSIDGLETILMSKASAILAWLATDVRAMTWSVMRHEHGVLKMVPSGCQNDRVYQGALPSYIYWKIKYLPWLLSTTGDFVFPAQCVINDMAVSGIFPKPVTLSEEELDLYGVDQNILRHAWLNAGVRGGVEDLDSEEVYQILFDLPSIDPSGKLAKKLYNWLIKTVDFEPNTSGKYYKKFCEEGLIYSVLGEEEGYRLVTDVYHVDVEGFPVELLKNLPVASLLKKRGASKVSRLFGVKVLDKKSVNERVTYHIAADCAARASTSFQQCKNYIKVYRHNHTTKPLQLKIFEALELIVCVELRSEITFNDQVITSRLPAWTYSIQENQLFVSCDPIRASDESSPLLANTIGDAIAAVFGITDGTPFAQLYQCDQLSRMTLLKRMLGEEIGEDIQDRLQAIEDECNQIDDEEQLSLGEISSNTPLESSGKTTKTPASTPPVEQESSEKAVWVIPGELGVESEEHIPTEPCQRVDLKVSGGSKGSSSGGSRGSSGSSTGSASDGKAGEELAMLFEIQQGRFPLYVGDRTGYKTISCDVLSFRTEADREAFKSGKDQRKSLIERVIESKEKWNGGPVKLSHNEVTEASEWREKYFIYRFKVIDANNAEYQLKMLANPLVHLEAVVSKVELSIDAAATTEQFRIFDINKQVG